MYGSSTKEALVDTARQAREERALKRKQEVSAIRIQSAARGFLQRVTLRKTWCTELDEVVGHSDQEKLQREPLMKTSKTSLAGGKIFNASNQQVPEEWKFASFSSNTLIGAYGNLSTHRQTSSASEPSRNEAPDHGTPQIAKSATFPETQTSNINNVDCAPAVKSHELPLAKEKVSSAHLLQLLRKFLFVFNYKRDRRRFLQICRFLLSNTDDETSIKNSYVALCVHKQHVKTWISQVKLILWTCCKYLDEIQVSKDFEALPTYLRMLITFTDISHWKSLKKQKVLRPVLAQVCNNISSHMCQRGSMCIIGTLLASSKLSSLSPNSMQACLTLTIRWLTVNDFNEDYILMFIQSLLSVPSLVWHLKERCPQVVKQILSTSIVPKILAMLYNEGECTKRNITPKLAQTSDVTKVLCFFANLLQLLVCGNDLLKEKAGQIVMLFNQLLKFLFENTSRNKGTSSTWHPVLGYFTGNKLEFSDSMQFVKRQLELLWDPVFVKAVFHDVLTLKSLHEHHTMPTQAEQITARPKVKVKLSDKLSTMLKRMASSRPQNVLLPTGGRKLEYSEVRNTCSACLMYKRALGVFTRQLQLEMLTGLTFMDEVLCRLWRFICELGPSGGLELFLSALTLPSDVAEPYFAVFTLFCDMTAHILSILDDVEFYDHQVPFHLEELVTVSAFLRQFVFKVIWGQIVTDGRSSMYPVFNSSHTLLVMLYDRDARRGFTPKEHWLCKDVKASQVRSEFEKGSGRAKLILEKIPFVIPHKDRVILFNSFVSADKQSLGITNSSDSSIHIKVRRSRLVEDGFDYLSSVSSAILKGVIRVKFFNDLGLDEAGIDQDGVFKEFLEEIIKKVFNPDMNLFKVTNGHESRLYPSPASHLEDNHLSLFSFVGRMLGKAVYEGIVLDIPFANFFLRNLLGQQQHAMLYSPIDELPSLDLEFYNNLTWIKRYEGDIADIGLTFTYEEDVMGRIESHDLIPGGSVIPVTNENRIMYIHTLAHYRMHTQIQQQIRAFVTGFRSIIAPAWTAMFSAPELQRLISGDNVDMDLGDLKKNVVYYGGFHSSHRVVRWLWDILERDYTPSQRAAFLKFVTSCSRPPLLGFCQLKPQFSIRCVDVPDEEDTGDTVATVLRGFFRLPSSRAGSSKSPKYPHRLPTASTCFNLLKLPNYPSKEVLREKLKQAIANNTGFELS